MFKRTFSTSVYASSKIGSKIIKYWPNISISVLPHIPTPSFPTCDRQVMVEGPLGKLQFPIHPFVHVEFPVPPEDSPKKYATVRVNDEKDKFQRSMWGTTQSLLDNMVEGVSTGFSLPIRLNGIGYRASLETPGQLTLRLGYANPINMELVEGVEVIVPNPQKILLKGIDLQKVTQYAANIRRHRKPEPYNLKGVFVGDETIKKKTAKGK